MMTKTVQNVREFVTNWFKKTDDDVQVRKFGTFGGVFTPNTLTILGVIMYLRMGWVVGNAGLLGAVVIVILAKLVTICTGLAMSSITTNIKIGAGGAYSIISKSLGLEAGGSVGIPLYIAQTLSAALYILGFTEGWLRVFPNHDPLVVSYTAWAILLAITFISAHFAIRIQYFIMAIIAVSLVSFWATPVEPLAMSEVPLIGNFEDAGFWQVFAIFFPAVTGIMAGANMSGDLKNPRQALPIGTMSSIIVTMLIYLALAVTLAVLFSPEELRTNQMIMVDGAWWGGAVLAGIIGATLSSALGSMLGAPRLLQALAEQKTVPLSNVWAAKTASNEPRNATLFTGAVIAVVLLGDLDFLAGLITMFFLITYGMLNLVVLIQQGMKIISFRPTFKIPWFVSFFGATACVFMMFLISPLFSIVALSVIIVTYVWLVRRELQSSELGGDIRGGLFLVLAEYAARLAEKFPRSQISWKPDLLIPIEDPKVWAGPLLFIRNIILPSGSIFAFTVQEYDPTAENHRALAELLAPLKGQGTLVNSTVIEDVDFLHGAKLVIQTLKGGSFRPNTLFLTIGENATTGNGSRSPNVQGLPVAVSPSPPRKDSTLNELVKVALRYEVGVILLRQHPLMAFGIQQDVNLWLRDKSPNWHLAILIGLQLQLNWGGKINLITATEDPSDEERLYEFLEFLADQTRMPSVTEFYVLQGNFRDTLGKAPRADVNIFGLSLIDDELPVDFIRDVSRLVKSSCVFVIDSGKENAMA